MELWAAAQTPTARVRISARSRSRMASPVRRSILPASTCPRSIDYLAQHSGRTFRMWSQWRPRPHPFPRSPALHQHVFRRDLHFFSSRCQWVRVLFFPGPATVHPVISRTPHGRSSLSIAPPQIRTTHTQASCKRLPSASPTLQASLSPPSGDSSPLPHFLPASSSWICLLGHPLPCQLRCPPSA